MSERMVIFWITAFIGIPLAIAWGFVASLLGSQEPVLLSWIFIACYMATTAIRTIFYRP
jgi:hypothetical protein